MQLLVCVELITNAETLSIGMGTTFIAVCLFVVCLQHNSKTKEPSVFKLGIENDLGIAYK